MQGLMDSGVSIHALLAECDDLSTAARGLPRVSIHALLAECDTGSNLGG